MRLLLDSCTFLWLTSAADELGREARARLDEDDAEIFLSDVSVWEIALKWHAGKIRLPAPPRNWIEEQAETWALARLPITPEHCYRTTELPDVHRDPFDRLLVAQAIGHGLAVVTPDPHIRQYPVASIW